jgi:hypothetical protein
MLRYHIIRLHNGCASRVGNAIRSAMMLITPLELSTVCEVWDRDGWRHINDGWAVHKHQDARTRRFRWLRCLMNALRAPTPIYGTLIDVFFVVIGFGFIYRERRVEWDSMWWHWCEREEKEYDMTTIRLYRSRRMTQSRLLSEAFRIILGLILWDRSCFIRITEHRVRQNPLFIMMCYAHTTCSPNIVMKLTRAFFCAWHLAFTWDRKISLLWVTNHQS